MTGGRYMLTGRDFLDQNGHNNFEIQKGLDPGLFLFFSGSEGICLLVCPATRTYVLYPTFEKKMFAQLLRLKEVTIPVYSVSIEHEYLQ